MLVFERMHYYQSALLVVHALHYPDVDENFFSTCTTHGKNSLFSTFEKFLIFFVAHALLSENIDRSAWALI